MSTHLDILTAYFDLVQAFETDPTAFAAVLHPEVEQIEYPNLLNRTIQRRSFTEILDNLRLGRELVSHNSFEIERAQPHADGSILVEGKWHATATNDIGPLLRGQRLIGYLCLIFEFKDGKIYRQRRYPCYDIV